VNLIDQYSLEVRLTGAKDTYERDDLVVHVGKRVITIYGDGTITIETEGVVDSYVETTVKKLHKTLLKADKEDEPPSVVVTDPWVKNILSANRT
jgi:ArsR family metal-binding transcriptional regulator